MFFKVCLISNVVARFIFLFSNVRCQKFLNLVWCHIAFYIVSLLSDLVLRIHFVCYQIHIFVFRLLYICFCFVFVFRRLHRFRRCHVLARRARRRRRGRRTAAVHHRRVGDQRKKNQVGNR
jgi:hypothetical protein